MTYASNPQHLPPEKSAREYEAKVADLTAKLQAVCPHALRHHISEETLPKEPAWARPVDPALESAQYDASLRMADEDEFISRGGVPLDFFADDEEAF